MGASFLSGEGTDTVQNAGANKENFLGFSYISALLSGTPVGFLEGQGDFHGIMVMHGISIAVFCREKQLKMLVDGIGDKFVAVYHFIYCHNVSFLFIQAVLISSS